MKEKNEDEGKKDDKLSIGDLATRIDSRLRFLEVAFWNMAEGQEQLDKNELSTALTFMIEDIRKDVKELYDFE